MSANLFDSQPDLERDGVVLRGVGSAAGSELLGATAYELAPGSRWADLHYHHANEERLLVLEGTPALPDVVEYPESDRVFVMSEPPWTDAPYDEARGRVIRSFAKNDGRPVPPDT